MIDCLKLTLLLEEFGIPFQKDYSEESWNVLIGDDYMEGIYGMERRTEHPKVTGYSGFFTRFEFSPKDGSFVKVGAWE
jgi:hypothetical protein